MTITAFVAVYRGPTVGTAKLVALSVDPELIEELVAKLSTTTFADDPCTAAEAQRNGTVNDK